MRGIITAIHQGEAVVLNDAGEFIVVKNKNYSIGNQIEYKNPTYKNFYSMAASFILLLFFSLSGYAVYYTPVSYLSIDINPSLQFDINRFGRVIGVHPLNEDAVVLLSDIQVKNEAIEETVEKVILKSQESGYLTEQNNQVIIDIVTTDNNLAGKVDKNTAQFVSKQTDIQLTVDTEETLSLSKNLGISIGRAKAIREYTEKFGGNEADNANALAHYSVGELKKQVTKQEDSFEQTKGSDEHQPKVNNKTKQNKNQNDKPNKEKKKDNSGLVTPQPTATPNSTQSPDKKNSDHKPNNSSKNQSKKNNVETFKSDSNDKKNESGKQSDKNTDKNKKNNNSNSKKIKKK